MVAPLSIYLLIALVILAAPYVLITLLAVVLGGASKIAASRDYRSNVTIFLPTYNEEDFIGKKLDDLLTQTYPISEILVIDCSLDRTPEIVQTYQKRTPVIRLIHQEKRIGNAKTFNLALESSKGDILIKTDCDSLSKSNDSIAKLVSNFSDPKVGGATGVCVSAQGVESYFRRIMTRIQVMEMNLDSTVIGHSTSFLAFRKTATSFVNPDSMAEDTEELILVRKNGYRTVVDTKVVSVEEVPIERRTRRSQKSRRAQGIIGALFESRNMVFKKKYGRFGSLVLPIEFFILVASPVVLPILIIILLMLAYSISLYLLVLLLVILIGVTVVKRALVFSIIDTQFSSLTATLRTIFARQKPVWEKVR